MGFGVGGEDEKTGRKQDDFRADGDELGKSRCVACGRWAIDTVAAVKDTDFRRPSCVAFSMSHSGA